MSATQPTITRRPRGPWWLVRRISGYTCLGIGVLGAILPIIPGWPGFFLAVALLGRRDRSLRLTHLFGRHALRRLRKARQPLLRSIGIRISSEYVSLRRQMLPYLDRAERLFGT